MSDKARSDVNRAFAEDGALKTHVGGQALIEGVMMRGKYNWAVAVREPDGAMYVEEHDLGASKARNGFLSLPFVRGCVALVESLALGFKALGIAGEHAFKDPSDEDEQDRALASMAPEERADEFVEEAADKEEGSDKEIMAASMALGVVLGIVLFIVAPAFITNLIVGEYDSNPIVWNVVDGVLRVAVFILYIWLIGHMEDMRRMFMYHGAEHKAIHCYEHGLDLTPQNARNFPRLHVRCGTAFLIMVLILAIIIYTMIPVNLIISGWGIPDGVPKLALVIAIRLLFLPLIAGIAYEITVKWAGNHPDNPVVKVVLWPGLQMQNLTTNEPDDSQLECAIAAMKRVLAREEAITSSNQA